VWVQKGVRDLLGLAALTSLVGVLASLITAEDFGSNTIASSFVDTLDAALGSGVWWLLSQLTLAVAALVAVSQAGSVLFTRRKQNLPDDPVSEAAATNLQEALLQARRLIEERLLGEHPDVIAAFDETVRGAVQLMASDIHMSPGQREFRVTYRIHGTLREVCQLPADMGVRLTARAKVLAQLETHVRGTPQDGRIVMELDGQRVDARVSCLPTETGERVVMRLVSGSQKIPELGSLGFSDEVLSRLRAVLAKPQGLIFVTAPVGSGKTTTLYACLRSIATSRGTTTSIVTLEDPIEMELPFATQTQMHARSGMTFAATLRSVLRQDPNVLMVGEIRDRETADIAVQAGLTGHLILTTVHGENAAAPFARLAELEVEPFVLASATVASLSQRLVRTLCTACRRKTEPDALQIERFGQQGIQLPAAQYYEPVGCDYCERLGFTGRSPIVELMVLDSEIRKAVHDRRPTSEIQALALERGMISLLRSGLLRATRGETSLAEVLRVAG
jgi:general secretion pathway protein E